MKEMSDLDQKLTQLCRQGKFITAIKHYRTQKKCSLKKAKDYIDNMKRVNRIEDKSGCFVATACFGNYDAPEVLVLREYRDTELLKTNYGRLFVKIYYYISPFLARQIEK